MTNEKALEVLDQAQQEAYKDGDYDLLYALETAIKAIKEKDRLEQYIIAQKEKHND